MTTDKAANRSLTLKAMLCLLALFVPAVAQNTTNGRSRAAFSNNKELRKAIVRELGTHDGELKFVSRQVDLNGDGRSEVIVWVPTSDYGGSGGYPVLVLQRNKNRYKRLSTFHQVWTPLIVLHSSKHGWRDIVMQMGGGGEEMHYILLRHDGQHYSYSDDFTPSKTRIARGQVLISKDWSYTMFGPMPK